MANLFSDGFESGDFTAWSTTVIDGGDLSVAAAAALNGNYGMSALLDDNTAIYVQDNTPSGETRYRCRFYFDPNSITMAALDNHWILELKKADATGVGGLILRYNSGYEIRLGIQNDTPAFQYTAYAAVSDGPHYIEVDWKASSGAGANDGTAEWWLDGVSQASLSSLDNDTYTVDYIMFGAVVGIDTGTRGTYYFDTFASNNDGGLIGPYVPPVSGDNMSGLWTILLAPRRRRRHIIEKGYATWLRLADKQRLQRLVRRLCLPLRQSAPMGR